MIISASGERGFEHLGRHRPRVENGEIGQLRQFILRSLAEDQRHGPRLWVDDDPRLTHRRDSSLRLTNIVANYWVKSALSRVYRPKIPPLGGSSRRASDEYFAKADFVIILRHAEDFLQSDFV